MKINISTHGITLTEALQAHVTDKLAKAAEHYPEVVSTEVILHQETKTVFSCELIAKCHGQSLSVNKKSDNMYQAITTAAKTFYDSLKKQKEQGITSRNNRVEPGEHDHTHEHLQEIDLAS